MTAGEVEVLFKVGGFDVDGGMKMILTQVHQGLKIQISKDFA